MEGWVNFYQLLERGYFTEGLKWLVELIAIAIGVSLIYHQAIGRVFLIYLLVDFIILNFDFYLVCFSKLHASSIHKFIHVTNLLISLIELLTYYYFFNNILRNFKIIRFTRYMGSIFILIVALFTITKFTLFHKDFGYTSYAISALGFILLIPTCIFYFHELLNSQSDYDLFSRPSFWIVSGIFFYALISIPFSLLHSYFGESRYKHHTLLVSLLYNIPLTINFLFLTKAFLCKKLLTI
jgi:hypothetical protein